MGLRFGRVVCKRYLECLELVMFPSHCRFWKEAYSVDMAWGELFPIIFFVNWIRRTELTVRRFTCVCTGRGLCVGRVWLSYDVVSVSGMR